MTGRLDAVWGSRRLSMKDIEASYRLRYKHKAIARLDQLGRQPPAERRVSRALRPLYLRHAVGRSRRPRRLSDEPAGGARRQTGESVSAVRAALAKRPTCSKRRSSFSRSRPTACAARRRRRPSVAGTHRLAAHDAAEARQSQRRRGGHAKPPSAILKVIRRASPDTVLIIPAAGAGTRLQSTTPKVLSPVNGRPMIDHLFDVPHAVAAIRARGASLVRSARQRARAAQSRRPRRRVCARRPSRPACSMRFSWQRTPSTTSSPAPRLDHLVRSDRRASRYRRDTASPVGRAPGRRRRPADGSPGEIRIFISSGTRTAASSASGSGAKGTPCRRSARATWDCSRCRRTATLTGCRSFGREASQARRDARAQFSAVHPVARRGAGIAC